MISPLLANIYLHWFEKAFHRPDGPARWAKTRIVDLKEVGESLEFLGFTFRYDRDLRSRGWRYLNVFPARKSLARARDPLWEMISQRWMWMSLDELIGRVNCYLRGWERYFDHGYPAGAF